MLDYIVLPILFHSESTKLLQSCNIKNNINDFIVRDVAFFAFDYIMPMEDGETEYSKIQIGNSEFYSSLTMEEILDLIDETSGDFIINSN